MIDVNSGYEFRVNGNFSGCCGATVKPNFKQNTGDIPARRWKNQYGEGVIPAVAGTVRQLTNEKHQGILLLEGKFGTKLSDEIHDVKHIKTKNGTITVVIRKKW